MEKKKRATASDVGHDLLRCLIAGILVSAIAAAVGATLGLLLFTEEVAFPPLQGAVSALMLVGSFSMLCSAFFFAQMAQERGFRYEQILEPEIPVLQLPGGFSAHQCVRADPGLCAGYGSPCAVTFLEIL